MKICILCGGLGHDQQECPWENKGQGYSNTQMLIIGAAVALASIGLTLLVAIYLHGVSLSVSQFLWVLAEMFISVSSGTALSTKIYKAKFWRKILARWKYRKIDPKLCCCGSIIGEGGSLCHHGGCRSAKEYAISSEL